MHTNEATGYTWGFLNKAWLLTFQSATIDILGLDILGHFLLIMQQLLWLIRDDVRLVPRQKG